jgi:hypothetical protein
MELKKTYVEKMKVEEEKFVDKLVEVARRDEELENSKGIKRVANKIMKTLTVFDFRFRRTIKRYIERKHLEKTVKSYYKEANLKGRPYKDWYVIEIPELFVLAEEAVITMPFLNVWTEEVKPKLLTVKSIMKVFNLDKQKIDELKEKAKISPIRLKDEEFIRREDFPKIAAFLNIRHPFTENIQATP